MALPMKHVYLYRTGINLIFKNNKLNQASGINCLRQLRGSRMGRELDKTEAKFQQLLKSLKETKKSVIQTNEIPDSVLKVVEQKESINVQNNSYVPLEDTYKRLEGRITPLKKLPYVRQLERKYNKCLSLLRMYGEKLRALKVPLTLGPDKLPCPVELMLPSEAVEGCRNTDEFSIGTGIDGNPKTVGYYLENFTGENDLVCVGPEGLVIIKDIHKAFVKDFQTYIQDSPLSACPKNSDNGFWKSVIVRSNKLGELMGIITVQSQSLTSDQLETEKMNLKRYFENSDLSYNLKSLYFRASSPMKSSSPAPYELLLGSSHLIEDVNGIQCSISPESFFYSNTHSVEAICSCLRKLCRVNSDTTVLDVFCGTGPVSLTFSPFVKKCIGIDMSSQAIEDARKNAELNNRHNIEFIKGNPDHILGNILHKDFHDDLLVVINPSKFELSKSALKQLRECKHLKKIVYISSKPRVTIDNFVKLSKPAGGETFLGKYFVPLLAVPVDVAPQTEHFGLIMMYQRL